MKTMPANERFEATTRCAWLHSPGGVIVYAESIGKNDADLEVINFFENPVVQLINGINCEFGVERFRYLRNTIITDYELSEWERNIIKVCAKRYVEKQSFENDKSKAKRLIQIGRPIKAIHEARLLGDYEKLFLGITEALHMAYQTSKSLELSQGARRRVNRDRHVAAILLDNDGRLVMAARNTNHSNQIMHAEVNLLVNYAIEYQTKIPKGAALVCSLKPCRMCASLLLSLCEDPLTMKVYAAEDDRGCFGRHKILGNLLTIGLTNE
jgi:tRNA(Arg) A34 adenosine deaminase TadA